MPSRAVPGRTLQIADRTLHDGTVHIALTAAVAYGTATDELVRRIRSVITLAADQLFGLTVSSVDVDIVDVYPAPGTPR